jgi:hypothetical protein
LALVWTATVPSEERKPETGNKSRSQVLAIQHCNLLPVTTIFMQRALSPYMTGLGFGNMVAPGAGQLSNHRTSKSVTRMELMPHWFVLALPSRLATMTA